METMFFSSMPGWLQALLWVLLIAAYIVGQMAVLRAASRAWERHTARKRREQWTTLLNSRGYERYWIHDTKELAVALEERANGYRVLTLKYIYGARDQNISGAEYATLKEANQAYNDRVAAIKAQNPA